MKPVASLALWNRLSVWCIGIDQSRVTDCWLP
jgi:hypothetical protein